MKKLHTLNIRDLNHLSKHLCTSPKEMELICENPKKYYQQFKINKKGKKRPIANPKGSLRRILDNLQFLLQRIQLPDNIHGGLRGCSNITNALPHIRKKIVLKMDIEDFFPWVNCKMVYDLFSKRLGCSPDVSRYLTRMTTLNGSVPQGSPTSTIIASLVIEPMVKRLDSLAKNHRTIYTQYVDDTTLSGPGYIKRLKCLIYKIIRQEGFRAKVSKTEILDSKTEQVVTGVKVNKGKDSPKEKIKKVRNSIEEIKRQKELGFIPSQKELASIKGSIYYIKQLNPGASKSLMRRLNRVLN